MDASVMLLVPLLVLGVVAAVAFAGCGTELNLADDPDAPAEDAPAMRDRTKDVSRDLTPGHVFGPGPGPGPSPPDAYPKLILTKGGATGSLRSYWRLAEALAAQAAADSEPTQPKPGTYKGNVTLNAPGVLRVGSDPNDAAAEFNGTDAVVEVPFDTLVNPPSAFSLEAWVRPAALAAGVEAAVISSFEPQLGGGFVLSLLGVSTTSMKAQILIGEGGSNVKSVQANVALDGPAVVARDGWHHIVATYGTDAGVKKLRLYVDGGAPQELAPGAPQLNYLAAQLLTSPGPPFRIGAGPGATPSKYFKGRVDEVALYDAPLDGGTVAAHFLQATKK